MKQKTESFSIPKMEDIYKLFDEELRLDVFTLCLCVVAIDGKISLKERRYLRRLGSL